jgi:adenosylmethionine-8-amino-7-oxononanoate aminotransferase
VLLRPLVDVLVLMPILSSTDVEFVRIVTTLATAIDEVAEA